MADEKDPNPIGKDVKGRGVFNGSKVARKYEVRGWDAPDGKRTTILLAPGKSTLVPEPVAAYLLAKLSGGGAKFPDLLDADLVSPEATAEKKKAEAENASLKAENEALKAQLAELAKAGDDGKKKDGKDDSKKGGK